MQIAVVALMGRAGAGKSTICNLLQEWWTIKKFVGAANLAKRVSFADKVKGTARFMGWNGEKDEKGRRLLQLIGTECGRQCIDEDVWANHWRTEVYDCRRQWEAAGFQKGLIICDDLRFENEAMAVNSLPSASPGVYTAFVVSVLRREVETPCTHASENPPRQLASIVLPNEGTIQDLKNLVEGSLTPAITTALGLTEKQ